MLDIKMKKKIGQMIMCGFEAPYFGEKARMLIDDLYVGNFVLFSRNIHNRETTLRLCSELNYRARIKLGRRPFISIDEECGAVRRLNGLTTAFPGCLALSATNDPGNAWQVGEMLGRELIDLGINMDFAPDVDVNVNQRNPVIGMRSYGDSPDRVAAFGLAMAGGLLKAGVLPVFKHFPGHGDTDVDSHLGIPSIPHGMDRLYRTELYPFIRAIENGAECIMVSHLLFRSIDPDCPATLSEKVINGFLRSELGFNGLVVTDCMEMKAITGSLGIGEACVKAIQAGVDMVLVSHTINAQKTALTAIYEAVESGRIDTAVINRSLERIERAKNRLPGLHFGSKFKRTKHNDFARNLYLQSVTLAGGALPELAESSCAVLGVRAFQGNPAEEKPSEVLDFTDSVSKSINCPGYSFDKDIGDDMIEELVGKTASSEYIILGMGDAHRFTGQRKLYKTLRDLGKRIIVVSLRMPYDIAGLEKPEAHLCTYEYTEMAIEAICLVIRGISPPGGTLPLSL